MKETERRILTAAEQAEPAPSARSGVVKVDELAQEIRRVDGSNSLGAGALAEALMPFLAAIEPAEPATDAEREFSEVLDGAQAFNDALPERMRKNARDWLRPDDEQVADEEPFESCPDCAGSGYSNHPDSGQVCYRCNGQGSYTHRHALTAAEQDQEDRS